MKRIYACILIVAALLGLSLYSSGRVQGFAQDISADLDCALEAVRQLSLIHISEPTRRS